MELAGGPLVAVCGERRSGAGKTAGLVVYVRTEDAWRRSGDFVTHVTTSCSLLLPFFGVGLL